MEFKLFQKLASLSGLELWMFLLTALVAAVLLAAVLVGKRKHPERVRTAPLTTRAMVYGAMCLSLSFALSYCKLFSMPFGGSITLCSMLPLAAYACAFGPIAGFTAALAYGVLQVVQGAWVVHWAQFLLDYFVAFACLGLASFTPGRLPLGMAIAGFARMLVSAVSGAIFFADAGLAYGILDPWVYTLAYNGLTVGAETVLCVLVALLPPVRRAIERLRS